MLQQLLISIAVGLFVTLSLFDFTFLNKIFGPFYFLSFEHLSRIDKHIHYGILGVDQCYLVFIYKIKFNNPCVARV